MASSKMRDPPGTRSSSAMAPVPPPVMARTAWRPEPCTAAISFDHVESMTPHPTAQTAVGFSDPPGYSGPVKLAEALGLTGDDIVAVVGGGGNSTAMFRLARDMVDRGERAITTTTTRIFGAQIALAPAHVLAADATRQRLLAELAAHRHLLVIGATDAESGKAEGVSLDLFRRLRAWCPGVCIVNEADGSR